MTPIIGPHQLLQDRNLECISYLKSDSCIAECFLLSFCSDEKKLIQKQMAFMLARQQIYLELDENMDEYDELVEIMSNAHLNNNFLSLAREVRIVPKVSAVETGKSATVKYQPSAFSIKLFPFVH